MLNENFDNYDSYVESFLSKQQDEVEGEKMKAAKDLQDLLIAQGLLWQ